ncbi:11542_t:CDS:2 [Ambispora gerdemannii]|uniref:alpha-1,2-Mannosidase n=1 Tax=Ambispora gerdemannii TaxID=144530 RepID=A0A9N9FWK2_9GLOM|nr:11542_t:CDS:2 [Ambispora gerdemannii]
MENTSRSRYSRDAWGFDEYHPITQNGSNLHDAESGIGFMIVDSLDTLIIMGLDEEYKKAREWVANVLDHNQDTDVSLFETTIRVLGGLLSAYHLSGKDSIYLTKATELADRLLVAFDRSESAIPAAWVNLNTTMASHRYEISVAEAGSLQLEFKYLSHLTGDPKYWERVEKIMLHIDKLEKFDGLAQNFLSISGGEFIGDWIGIGALQDSYYEYLLKQYLLTSKTEPMYLRMYNESIAGVKKHLLRRSIHSNLLYLGELYSRPYDRTNTKFRPKMEHLSCFVGAFLALGSAKIHDSNSEENLNISKELTHTCCEIYFRQATRLAPEQVYFYTNSTESVLDNGFSSSTENDFEIMVGRLNLYLIEIPEWGWRIFQAFEQYSKFTEGGYTEIEDVTVIPPKTRNSMPTFWLAETLKYLYLLFEDPDTDLLSLDKYVFNTEAHPFPIFVPSKEIRGEGWSRQ